MARTTVGVRTVAIVGGALTLSLPFAAQPSQAQGSVPYTVVNGTFASPAQGATAVTWNGGNPTWWGGNGQTVSATAAQRSDNLQAANLNWGSALNIYTRLWDVKKGSTVTVTFDDSTSTFTGCTAAQVAAPKQFTVQTDSPNSVQNKQTQPLSAVNKANWQQETFTFTASQDQPLVQFTSLETTNDTTHSVNCGPMIGNVRATWVPSPVDDSIAATNLKNPNAYQNNDSTAVNTVYNTCNGSPTACKFTVDNRYSYRYYDAPHMVGEAYINCTRNAVVDYRNISLSWGPQNSITQYAQNNGLTFSTNPDFSTSAPNLATQVAAGFKQAFTPPSQPLIWTKSLSRVVAPTIQPNEVSWIEYQTANERVEGVFDNTTNPAGNTSPQRLFATFDLPSPELGVRLYQRTMNLTDAMQQRCKTQVPDAWTPVQNRASGSHPSGLIAIGTPPAGDPARTVLLNPEDK